MLNKFLNLIKNAAIKGRDMALANRPLSAAIFATSLLAFLGGLDSYNTEYLVGGKKPISLEALLGGLLAIWGVFLLARRTVNQDRQLTIQINKEIDDRFIAAVGLLGNNQTSARTGAVYPLYQLAMESEKYREQIAQILCSHIRSKTQEKEYQVQYKDAPSNEIQTIIDILFKNINGVKGLYCHDFAQEDKFPSANLSYAHLCGANFIEAQCQRANFSGAYCQNVNFMLASCQRAKFILTKCWNAHFLGFECQNTIFFDAELWGADLNSARCQGANFISAKCQGASFRQAKCHGADFSSAECQGADFSGAQCQGGRFNNTAFQAAKFKDTNFQGAYDDAGAILSLDDRVGKTTEVTAAVFSGAFSLEEEIKKIGKEIPDYLSFWNSEMQEIQKASEGESPSYDIPEGINVGVLEDGEEIRKIAEEIRKWTR